jgi:hypothetical protein
MSCTFPGSVLAPDAIDSLHVLSKLAFRATLLLSALKSTPSMVRDPEMIAGAAVVTLEVVVLATAPLLLQLIALASLPSSQAYSA